MDKGFGSVLPTIPPPRKAAARAALVDVSEPTKAILTECFRQFGIETVPMHAGATDRLRKEKFEACVVRLEPSAQAVMEAARSSPSNTRMIIYGLGGTAQDAMQFSKYGINAVFSEPVERPTALKVVRATQMLVLHEFRRYVRVPVITEVSIVSADRRRFTATSKEISSGGMSLKSSDDLDIGTAVEVSFALLTLPRIWVKGVVAWKSKNTFGVRFDAQDSRRFRIKEWVEAYLDS